MAPDLQFDRPSAPSTDALAAAVGAAGAQHGWWHADLRWGQTYARREIGAKRFTVVLESATPPQRLCIVESFATEPDVQGVMQVCIKPKHLGWLRLTRFPWDAKMPSLGAVLADASDATVVRYRPGKRCTLRVSRGGGQAVFAKVFSDERGAAIYSAGIMLWQARARGELAFEVAEPLGWDSARRTLWQGAVPGAPIAARLSDRSGVVLALRMGRALASLALAPSVRPGLHFDASGQQRRTQRCLDDLRRWLPASADAIASLESTLHRAHAVVPQRELRVLHGAPHSQQWLEVDDDLGLVDFDRLSLGDAELDVGTFLAEMDFENPRRFSVDRINAAFLEGYEAVAGRLDRRLLELYRGHKHLARAQRLARSFKPDAGERAAWLIASVHERLNQIAAA